MSGYGEVRRDHLVVATATMRLTSQPSDLTVAAELRYTSADPHAVTFVFSVPGSESIEWVFARDLLLAGLTAPAGIGDVQIFPSIDGVVLDLNSPDGHARLTCDTGTLREFTAQMLVAVPIGAEDMHLFLDQELAQLLGGMPMVEPREG